jgi:hypothetical protein
MPKSEAARIFGVSRSSVKRYEKRCISSSGLKWALQCQRSTNTASTKASTTDPSHKPDILLGLGMLLRENWLM